MSPEHEYRGVGEEEGEERRGEETRGEETRGGEMWRLLRGATRERDKDPVLFYRHTHTQIHIQIHTPHTLFSLFLFLSY